MAETPINDKALGSDRRVRLTKGQREVVRRRLAELNPVMATEEEVEAVYRRYDSKRRKRQR